MAINTEIGKSMIESYGISLIDEFLKVLISNPFKRNDELSLSVLSTINNISYYYTPEFDQDVLHVKQIDIMEGITILFLLCRRWNALGIFAAISEYISSANTDAVIEAIRILGNLSRSKITRTYVTETGIFIKLIDILNKGENFGIINRERKRGQTEKGRKSLNGQSVKMWKKDILDFYDLRKTSHVGNSKKDNQKYCVNVVFHM